jgi:GxxExxY protein
MAFQQQDDPETYAVIGAAMETHAQLGCGFLESVYQEAFAIELADRHIPFQNEVLLPVVYKGRTLQVFYRADFICFGDVLVELKALAGISDVERSQVINYLKASGIRRGLLINFGSTRLQFERLVFSKGSDPQMTQIPQI